MGPFNLMQIQLVVEGIVNTRAHTRTHCTHTHRTHTDHTHTHTAHTHTVPLGPKTDGSLQSDADPAGGGGDCEREEYASRELEGTRGPPGEPRGRQSESLSLVNEYTHTYTYTHTRTHTHIYIIRTYTYMYTRIKLIVVYCCFTAASLATRMKLVP